jgi:excisionase family DNA binding protein
VRVTEEDRRRLSTTDSADGWLPLKGAAQVLGVSQQTVLQRIKAGELQAVRVHVRRRSAWRILVPEKTPQQSAPLLFDAANS